MSGIYTTTLVLFALFSQNYGYPQRAGAVMFGGYYGRPSSTAFVQGETVGTNSFLGGNPSQGGVEAPVHEEAGGDDDGKVKPQLNPPNPGKDEDQEGSWPFGLKGHSYSFFPVVFGNEEGGGSDGNERRRGGSPANPIAVANSFSTGRGGVATSHATAYGDPYTAALLRSLLYTKGLPKQD